MRLSDRLFAASFVLLLAAFGADADAGTAVVIDRDALELVSAGSNECPSRRVIFVTRGGRVHAVCDLPPPKAAQPLPAPPPAPTWAIEQGGDLHEAIEAWLPDGWTLAWDTKADPLAAAAFRHQGAAMAAIAKLFDSRSVWADTALIACSFPNERILQVREPGTCGQP